MRERQPERRDVSGRGMLLFGAGFVGFLVLSLVTLFLLFGNMPGPVAFGSGVGPIDRSVPMLEREPRADRAAYEADKRQRLHSFGWVDRKGGIAHIPIEDAIAIVAARGVPDWGQTQTAPEDPACAVVAANVPRAPQECAGSATRGSGE